MYPEDLEIVCKGKGRCGETFRLGDVEKDKISIATKHLMAECPHCGKNTIITKKELGDKYDQVRGALTTKIEEGEKEKEENFEIYYAEGDIDSIVADGGLDRLKRRTFKDGLQDAEVPEKVIGKVLRRWDQERELHKDYGKLVLMLQNYIQDLKKVNGGLVQQAVNDLCTLGEQYDNTIYDPDVRERPKESEAAQRIHLRVPSSATRRAITNLPEVNEQAGGVLDQGYDIQGEYNTQEELIGELYKAINMQNRRINQLQKANARLRKQSVSNQGIGGASAEPESVIDTAEGEEEQVVVREPSLRTPVEVERKAVVERLKIVESKLDSMVQVKERNEELQALRSLIKEEMSPIAEYYGRRKEELDKGRIGTSDIFSHERELDRNDLERDRMNLEKHKFDREISAKEDLYHNVGRGIRSIGQSIGEGIVSMAGLEETEEGEKPAEEKRTVYMLDVKCTSCGNITHVPPEVDRITCPNCGNTFNRSDALLILPCPSCGAKNEVPARQNLFDCSNCGQKNQNSIYGG